MSKYFLPVLIVVFPTKRQRLFALLALLSLGGIAASGALRVDSSDAANADVGTQALRIVTGIISYSRWPAAPETYRFCIAGDAAYLRDPQANLSKAGEHALSIHLVDAGETLAGAGCHIVYLGALANADRKRLLAQAIEQPILTISENDELCAEASMFCLAVRNNEVSLLANLDTIMRSKVRINPKVLQLLQRRNPQP